MTGKSEGPEKDDGPMGGDETTESMVYDGDVYTALIRDKAAVDSRVAVASLHQEAKSDDDNQVWPFVR